MLLTMVMAVESARSPASVSLIGTPGRISDSAASEAVSVSTVTITMTSSVPSTLWSTACRRFSREASRATLASISREAEAGVVVAARARGRAQPEDRQAESRQTTGRGAFMRKNRTSRRVTSGGRDVNAQATEL